MRGAGLARLAVRFRRRRFRCAGLERGFGGEQFAYPHQAHPGLLIAVEDPGELLHRTEQHREVEDERDERAGGQGARGDPAGAEDECGCGGQIRSQNDEREVAGDGALGDHAGVEPVVGVAGEPGEGGVAVAERLCGAQAGDVFLQIGVDDADEFT